MGVCGEQTLTLSMCTGWFSSVLYSLIFGHCQELWRGKVWAKQLAGLLMGKGMAAYAGLIGEKAASYDELKAAVLHCSDVSQATYR